MTGPRPLVELFGERGVAVPSGSNRPLHLDDPSAAYVISEGTAELFFVPRRGGRRRHVVTLEAGRFLPGARTTPEGGHLVAVGTTTTRFGRVERADLEAWAADPAALPDVSHAVSSWAGAVASWLPEEAGLALCAPLFVACAGGGSGLQELPAFHERLLDVLARDGEVRDEKEAVRLVAREASDWRAELAAVAGLTEAIGAGAVRGAPAAVANPFEAAFRLVAKGARIDLPERLVLAAGPRSPVEKLSLATGVRVRAVSLDGEWWREDGGPLLGATADELTPLALLPAGAGRYEAVDPRGGSRKLVDASLSKTLSPRAWALYRTLPARALSSLDIVRFLWAGSSRDLLSVAAAGGAAGLFALAVPIATGGLVDHVIPAARPSALAQVIAALAVAAAAGALFELVRSFAVLRLTTRTEAHLSAAVWDRLLSLPVSFFARFSVGDLAARSSGIEEIRRTLAGGVLSSLLAAIFSVFSFGLLLKESASLALLAVALSAVNLAFLVVSSLVQLRMGRRSAELAGRLQGFVLQMVNGIAKLRQAGAEPRAFSRWAGLYARMLSFTARGRRAANVFAVFGGVFPVASSIALFSAVVAAPQGSRLTAGAFLAFSAAWGQFQGAFLSLGSVATQLVGVVPAWERALPILEAVPEADSRREDPGPLHGNVEAEGLRFRYDPEGPPVLDGVSFHASPGEFIAFVGPSGAGKSTLLRLLLGFAVPEAGELFFDGRSLSGLDPRAVRRQVGVVLQDGRLMAGTIHGNIAGGTLLSTEEAWEAARLAGLDEDIRGLPMGMQTFVSEGAATFSGGQRQRLLIARAVAQKPKILLFDEATSALDNRTQAVVSEGLASLRATRIVIAHRLSTVKQADRIYVLEAGRIVEAGQFDALMARGGLFATLARRQLA